MPAKSSSQPSSAPESFEDILDKPMSAVERPKPLPVGSYVCVVDGQPRQDKSKKQGTPFVEFTLKVLQPGPDIDAEALAEINGGVAGKTIRATYYVTEDSVYRLRDFLVNCGIEAGSMGIRQAIAEAQGRQVMATVGHRVGESNGDAQIYVDLKATAAV